MNNEVIITMTVLIVVLIAILTNKKVKAVFGKFKIRTENFIKKNLAKAKGNRNTITQTVEKGKNVFHVNDATIEGDDNHIIQN